MARMDISVQDAVIIVTGAGTGIGRATARMFAAGGARVVVVGRRAEPLAETAAGYDNIRPLVADITAEGAAEEIAGAVMESYGRLDVLVNNAGIVRGGEG
jgi:NADP-dependent 3-hydroxy acid dehydrogenase YdfG